MIRFRDVTGLFFAIALILPVSTARSEDEPPNVLMIITDEHNFRTLGCYRQTMSREQAEMWGVGAVVTTPHLDALAKDGVLCTRAYATSPVCSPCRAALITGRYPHATGVPENDMVLDRSVPTLADRLNDAGYRTAFIGKWHLGGQGKPEWSPKVDGGFQFKKYMFNRGHWKKLDIKNGIPFVAATNQGEPTYNLGGADEKTFTTDWLTDRAIEFITETDASKPFFTVISYPDPHGPNSVRPPYDHMFDGLPFTPPRTYRTGDPKPKWLASKNHPIFRGDDMSTYFGMVKCFDDNIGRLVARMKESGQLDNTLLIMTSDHGDLCYEHDRQNKGNPYEGSARVPMILRQPGRIAAGEYFTQPMGSVDITPTVLGLLGLPGNPDDHGRDLSAQLANDSKPLASDESAPATFLRIGGKNARWVAAVDARYKLVLSVNDDPWLFDAREDPDELQNFYGRPGTQDVSKRLAKALREYGKTTKDPHLRNDKIAASLASVLAGDAARKQNTGERNRGKKHTEKFNSSVGYKSDWRGSRQWIGPDWWANPMTDWMLRQGAAVAAAAADRTLCLLPADLGSDGNAFQMSVEVESLGNGADVKRAGAGFRIGRRGGIDDYRHSLVHATDWIDAKIRPDGRLVLGDSLSEQTLSLNDGPVMLKLAGRRDGDSVELTLSATRGSTEINVTATAASKDVAGGISLLSDGGSKSLTSAAKHRYAFRDFELSGDLVRKQDDRSFGPILWSQYTLSNHRMRLQAQLAPLGSGPNHKAELWIADTKGDPQWKKIATETMDKLSRSVRFTIDDWNSEESKRYQVRLSWREKQHVWEGQIRREPAADEPLKLGCFSCDNGYLFPIPAMVSQVERQDPDIVFFAGDQIYEGYGGFGVAATADTETAMVDYLRKVYQFGWTWRDVLRDRPSVILPDDHDVFQGNIWGHGGRKLPASDKKNDWGLGGYKMPGKWVSAVERTLVGSLPDPAVDMTLPIGIKPYFTSMAYGGVGFAILEDRKFKTGHLSLPAEARMEGDGADLLGKEQEAFLKDWAEDWTGQRMKCALSQTIFCKAATHTGYNLKRGRSYYDSGAWPKAARNRAVRILGEGNALSIHGDQHLGVLLRQGVNDFDDAGYAFMVPGTANGFPRAWWPGVNQGVPTAGQKFTGKFRDDAGHPIHVLAVGNPEPGSNLLPKTNDPMTIGYRKGSGYGMVEFDTANGTAKVSMYRLGDQEEMFPGFPQTIEVGGKP